MQSPNLSFLGTPTLSRLSNSFLAVTDSFRSKTPEIVSNFVKPLLSPATSDEQQQHEDTRKSSQHLLPSRKPSLQQIPEDQKPLVAGHEVSPYRNCSYTQGVMNGKPVYYFWDAQRHKECESYAWLKWLIQEKSIEICHWWIPARLNIDAIPDWMSKFNVPILHPDIHILCSIVFSWLTICSLHIPGLQFQLEGSRLTSHCYSSMFSTG